MEKYALLLTKQKQETLLPNITSNEHVEARPSSNPDKATRVQRDVAEVAEVSRKTSGGSRTT